MVPLSHCDRLSQYEARAVSCLRLLHDYTLYPAHEP